MEGSQLAWPHQHDPCMCVKARANGQEWSGLGWELIHVWQHVRGRVGAGELPKKPGLLLLSNSAEGSRTWELGWRQQDAAGSWLLEELYISG